MTQDEFKQSVLKAGNTGSLVELPDNLDKWECGNIMADAASFFLDRGEDVKAIIILEERRRLGV